MNELSERVDVTREYTTSEIAELVGVSMSYLRRLLGEDKVLHGRNVGGRLWLVSGRELRRWLETREH